MFSGFAHAGAGKDDPLSVAVPFTSRFTVAARPCLRAYSASSGVAPNPARFSKCAAVSKFHSRVGNDSNTSI